MAEPVIAVIGAGGSVGRALSSLLIARAPAVRLFNRTPGELAGRAFEALPRTAADLAGVHAVVHLAGVVRGADETLFHASNVELPCDMARIAMDAGVARFVFQSSMAVNGHSSSQAFTPDTPFAPDSSYGASKVAAERALQDLLKDSSTRLVIFRPPLVYGPGLRTKFGAFVRAARIGAPLPIGLATARRSMVSLTNLTDAILLLCHHERADKAPLVLLPADDRDLMVRETYASLCRLTGKRTWQPPLPLWAAHGALRLIGREEAFDSIFRPATIDRAHWADVGWSPPQSVEDGLREAVV